ncbi:hypothetical protein BKA70DRAFT_876679 [Coprinopsis sp. MPI-PUGE-AT-0042]|nr:hypothetical protein BKA70DRAFT_876679 [Coprinopsis sp. MPI-PUGE-AT-0042]
MSIEISTQADLLSPWNRPERSCLRPSSSVPWWRPSGISEGCHVSSEAEQLHSSVTKPYEVSEPQYILPMESTVNANCVVDKLEHDVFVGRPSLRLFVLDREARRHGLCDRRGVDWVHSTAQRRARNVAPRRNCYGPVQGGHHCAGFLFVLKIPTTRAGNSLSSAIVSESVLNISSQCGLRLWHQTQQRPKLATKSSKVGQNIGCGSCKCQMWPEFRKTAMA